MVARLCKLLLVLDVAKFAHCQEHTESENGTDEMSKILDDMYRVRGHNLENIAQHVDADRDGQLSFKELLAYEAKVRHNHAQKQSKSSVETMDTNGDGLLNFKEVFGSYHMEDMNDTDKLMLDKMQRYEETKFKLADKDGSGTLDHGEMITHIFPQLDDRMNDHVQSWVLHHADRDGDGVLSISEFQELTPYSAPSKELSDIFTGVDSDGDGKLTVQEFKGWSLEDHHAEKCLRELFRLSGKGIDAHFTLDEFKGVHTKEGFTNSDAHYMLKHWSDNSEL